jgi:hypothetical protein
VLGGCGAVDGWSGARPGGARGLALPAGASGLAAAVGARLLRLLAEPALAPRRRCTLPGHIETLAHRYLGRAALVDLADLGDHVRCSNVDTDRSPSASPPLTRAVTDPPPGRTPPTRPATAQTGDDAISSGPRHTQWANGEACSGLWPGWSAAGIDRSCRSVSPAARARSPQPGSSGGRVWHDRRPPSSPRARRHQRGADQPDSLANYSRGPYRHRTVTSTDREPR